MAAKISKDQMGSIFSNDEKEALKDYLAGMSVAVASFASSSAKTRWPEWPKWWQWEQQVRFIQLS